MVNSKPKGNNYENEIAKQIRAKFVPKEFDAKTGHELVHRTPMSGGHVERGDILCKPPVWQSFPWFVECRNRQSWSFKNIMEKCDDSVIMQWFLEDAVEKCHAYDNNHLYGRMPLLIFTQKYHKDYFCAWEGDLNFMFKHTIVVDIFRPLIHAWRPVGKDGVMHHKTAVIGMWKDFLENHDVDHDEMTVRINKYLGRDNE